MGAYDVDHTDLAVARLATRQDGVVNRSQLAALGLSRRAIEHRLHTGRLIGVHRGVYAVGHTALTDADDSMPLSADDFRQRTMRYFHSLLPIHRGFAETFGAGYHFAPDATVGV